MQSLNNRQYACAPEKNSVKVKFLFENSSVSLRKKRIGFPHGLLFNGRERIPFGSLLYVEVKVSYSQSQLAGSSM